MKPSLHNTPQIKEALEAVYKQERERFTFPSGKAKHDGDYLNPVFGEGPIPCRALFIGEAPGKEEAACGRPFVGKAGKQLNDLLEAGHINRADVYVTNAVKYRPIVRSERSVRNRTPSSDEVKAALPALTQELLLLRPEFIVTFGNTPLRAILTLARQEIDTIGNLHGRCISITVSGFESTLFPMYHPASVIYNRMLYDVLRQDTKRLGEKLVNPQSDLFQDNDEYAIINSTNEGMNTL